MATRAAVLSGRSAVVVLETAVSESAALAGQANGLSTVRVFADGKGLDSRETQEDPEKRPHRGPGIMKKYNKIAIQRQNEEERICSGRRRRAQPTTSEEGEVRVVSGSICK